MKEYTQVVRDTSVLPPNEVRTYESANELVVRIADSRGRQRSYILDNLSGLEELSLYRCLGQQRSCLAARRSIRATIVSADFAFHAMKEGESVAIILDENENDLVLMVVVKAAPPAPRIKYTIKCQILEDGSLWNCRSQPKRFCSLEKRHRKAIGLVGEKNGEFVRISEGSRSRSI